MGIDGEDQGSPPVRLILRKAIFPGKECEKWNRARIRRDALRSVFIALGVNLSLAALLFLNTVNRPMGDDGRHLEVQSAASDQLEDSLDGDSPGDDGRKMGRPSSFTSLLPKPPEVPPPGMTFYEDIVSVDPSMVPMDPALSPDDFVQAERQTSGRSKAQMDEIRSVVSGKAGNAEWDGFFSAGGLGDGSGMVVFLDVSPSMRALSQMVGAYVRKEFPGCEAIPVWNCRMKLPEDWVVYSMWYQANQADRSKFVLICDLQDGDSSEGIQLMRESLLLKGKPKELHVISFDKLPSESLNKLIEETGGGFTYVNPNEEV